MRMHPRPESTHPRARRPRRAGTSTVQFAFCAPVFIFLVLGMVEVGRGIMVTHELTSAARNACRAGVPGTSTYSNITTSVDNDMKAQGITGYNTAVKVNGSTVTSKTFSPSSNDDIEVQVTVPVGNITWLPGGTFLRGSLAGQFCLRRE